MQNSTLVISQLEQLSSTHVNSAATGILGTALAGQTTALDLAITDDVFIVGGCLLASGATFGDYVRFQVVDKDNILGYGANLVLGQYINSWYLRSDSQLQINETMVYPAKVRAGLYLRAIYVSTGGSDVPFAINYRLHRALY